MGAEREAERGMEVWKCGSVEDPFSRGLPHFNTSTLPYVFLIGPHHHNTRGSLFVDGQLGVAELDDVAGKALEELEDGAGHYTERHELAALVRGIGGEGHYGGLRAFWKPR